MTSTDPRHRSDTKDAEAASHSTGTRGLRGRSTPEKRCNIMIYNQEKDLPRKKGEISQA